MAVYAPPTSQISQHAIIDAAPFFRKTLQKRRKLVRKLTGIYDVLDPCLDHIMVRQSERCPRGIKAPEGER